MYNRIIYPHLLKSKKSILLLGPRQVGKSTLINSLKPDLKINLAEEAEYFLFLTQLSELEGRIQATKAKTIFIDEIQRIPRLMNSIQALIDNNRDLKFYITGSSARKLNKGKANLLPGRVFNYQMMPLCFSEIKNDYDENKALQYGLLPEVYSMDSVTDKKKLLQSYANLYLKEEVIAESLVRGIEGFVRFLKEAAISSGHFLDYSKISKKSKVARQSVIRHFEILEDTLITRKVGNDPDLDPEQVDLIKHPKHYFFDVGVVNALNGSFDLSHDRIGLLWEHYVYNQITNSAFAFDKEINCYNFRTRGGLEVDFIVSNGSEKFAVECKSSITASSEDSKNLLQINNYYKKITKILVYRGKYEKKENGIWIVPLSKMLDIIGMK